MEIKVFNVDGKDIKVNVDYENKEVWLSQKSMALLFNKGIDVIKRCLSNLHKVFGATGADFALVQIENGREVKRHIIHYDLDIILKAGYKCNPQITISFKE